MNTFAHNFIAAEGSRRTPFLRSSAATSLGYQGEIAACLRGYQADFALPIVSSISRCLPI